MRLSYMIIWSPCSENFQTQVRSCFFLRGARFTKYWRKEIPVCPAIGTLGDYLRILNQTKIASCTAKRTSVGKGSGDEEVFDEVKLLNHRTGQAEETFDSRSLRGNQSQTKEVRP